MKNQSSTNNTFNKIAAEKPGAGALIDAVEQGDAEAVTTLLAQGANANEKNKYGVPALQRASFKRNRPEIIRLLIENKADTNEKDNHGDTALICAAWAGYVETVQELIKHGADTNIRNNDGDTALIMAAKYIREKTILDAQRDPDGSKLFNSEKELTAAEKIIRTLIENDADLHVKNKKGETAMTILTNAGQPEIAARLVEEETQRKQHSLSVTRQAQLNALAQTRKRKLRLPRNI